MQLRRLSISVSYNDKDITADVSNDLIEFTYTDKEHGAADTVSLAFNDKKLRWQNDWFPDKAARLKISFGLVGRIMPAGTFQIDTFNLSGPPDVAKITGIAAGITKDVRTKKNVTHENKTLKQIAQTVADAHGFTISGEIAEINIKREKQNKETDLGFLKRLAEEYGYIFSLRDSVITFFDIFDLEDIEPVVTLDKTECAAYDFNNKITGTYGKGRIRHTKSNSKYAIEANADLGVLSNGQQSSSADALEIHAQVEDELQGKFKVKAALHKHNKRLSECEIDTDGNPYLVAGNNVELTGFGEVSGTYHITESRHRSNKQDGYNTSFTAHKVHIPKAGTKRPKKTVAKTVAPTRGYVPFYDFNSLNG